MKLANLFCTVSVLFSIAMSNVALAGERINQVLDVQANGQVSIENMRGHVDIVGWDKNQVSVKGHLDDKARGYEFETDGGYTVFKVKMPKRVRNWNNSDGSDLKIFVPINSGIEFESVNGNVSLKAVAGGTNAHTVNGNIKAIKLSQRINLETVNGNIKASGLDGKIKLATVNGNVTDLDSKGKVTYTAVNGSIESHSVAKKISIENVNGEIELVLKGTEELEVSTVNGNIDAEVKLSDDSEVNISSVSGNAQLKLGGNIGGRYNLSAHAGGRITNELTDDRVQKEKYGPARHLKFRVDGGSAQVKMTSVSGNLTIEAQR